MIMAVDAVQRLFFDAWIGNADFHTLLYGLTHWRRKHSFQRINTLSLFILREPLWLILIDNQTLVQRNLIMVRNSAFT
jgi:hypothetical protein